jgi:hypothetical protein
MIVAVLVFLPGVARALENDGAHRVEQAFMPAVKSLKKTGL